MTLISIGKVSVIRHRRVFSMSNCHEKKKQEKGTPIVKSSLNDLNLKQKLKNRNSSGSYIFFICVQMVFDAEILR